MQRKTTAVIKCNAMTNCSQCNLQYILTNTLWSLWPLLTTHIRTLFPQPHIHRWRHSVGINNSSSLSCFHSFSLHSHSPNTHTHTATSCRLCCFITNRPWRETFFFFLMNTVNTNRTTVCLYWGPFLFPAGCRALAVSHLYNLRSIALTTAPAGCEIACYRFNGSPL